VRTVNSKKEEEEEEEEEEERVSNVVNRASLYLGTRPGWSAPV
jgi:hypothetical protein